MELKLAIMAGAESKAWLNSLINTVERLEAVAGKVAGQAKKRAPAEDEEEEAASDDDFPTKKKKAKSFEDDEDESNEAEEKEVEDEEDDTPVKTKKKAKAQVEDDEEESEDEEAPKAKSKKAPKLTESDVQVACKAHLAHLVKKKKLTSSRARKKVVALLEKHFDVGSVGDLKPSDYAEAIEVLEV